MQNQIQSSRTIVSNWGSDIGRLQADRFVARSYDVKRDFYVGKIDEFKQAYKLLKEGNADEAIRLVTLLSGSASKQIRDQVWFNLGHHCRGAGRPKQGA